MPTNENVCDLITKAEALKNNLKKVDEQVSEGMSTSIFLKGLTDVFETNAL